MVETVDTIIRDSVGLGVLFLVLVGIYRLLDRVLSIIEKAVDLFLEDFKRIADGISDIAETTATRKD